MRSDILKRPIISAVLFASLAACAEKSATSPLDAESAAAGDRGVPATTAGVTGQTATDSLRVCKKDEVPDLTERPIAQIRAIYQAFQAAAAEDLTLIAAVEEAARKAQQAGASREEVAKILARADEAKRHLAALEHRARAAINDILTQDQRRHRCVPVLVTPSA